MPAPVRQIAYFEVEPNPGDFVRVLPAGAVIVGASLEAKLVRILYTYLGGGKEDTKHRYVMSDTLPGTLEEDFVWVAGVALETSPKKARTLHVFDHRPGVTPPP